MSIALQSREHSSVRVLIVGVGGLGCPAAMTLAHAGIGVLGLCDDDVVDRTNLHRQILFGDADVGEPKVAAAARALRRRWPEVAVHTHETRLLPHNAIALVQNYDLVLEGSDNFATKFLTADACFLARVPVIHASAVRWIGTVLSVGAGGRPCYRCLFEEIPADGAPNCAEAGVMGPVLGVVAAAQAELAFSRCAGELVTFDGKTETFRRRTVAARAECALCGDAERIHQIEAHRYSAPACASP